MTLLEASGVQVRYQDGALGVVDISLQIDAGQTVALLGPNGAGKTTTLRAMSGYLRSEGTKIIRGKVLFNGVDITNIEPHKAVRLGVWCLPERRKIFPNLSVAQNLAAFSSPAGSLADRRAMVFDLFPILADRLHELAGRLSGGQQQMLALGRALLSQPQVLLLDEVTLGLHASLKPLIANALKEINRQGTAVLIADEAADLALSLADYCYVIRNGLVVKQGDTEHFNLAELAKGYIG